MSLAQSSDLWQESVAGPLNRLGLFSSGETEKRAAWIQRIDDVIELIELEDNWDGEGAEALSTELVSTTVEYMNILYSKGQLPPPTRVIASQDGEIIIEWQINNIYREAAISEPYHAEWMFVREDEPAIHWDEDWGADDQSGQQPSNSWPESHAA